MYGLPQSRLPTDQLLEKCLNKYGYHQSKCVPGMWKHKWCPVQFKLVVGDFGVKYIGKNHTMYLKTVLEEYYTIATTW